MYENNGISSVLQTHFFLSPSSIRVVCIFSKYFTTCLLDCLWKIVFLSLFLIILFSLLQFTTYKLPIRYRQSFLAFFNGSKGHTKQERDPGWLNELGGWIT